MSGSTRMFVRGFMVVAGAVLIFVGYTARDYLPLLLFGPLIFIGIIIVFIALYWWYKDFQKG